MDKSPDAFRTISEVAELLETPAHVLRFWESRFPQIRPVKRAGGRRYYRPADVGLLSGIKRLLHDEGMTIRGVQKILREQGVRYVSGMADDTSTEDEEAALEAALASSSGQAEETPSLPPADAESAQIIALQTALNEPTEKTSGSDADVEGEIDTSGAAAPEDGQAPAPIQFVPPVETPEPEIPVRKPPVDDGIPDLFNRMASATLASEDQAKDDGEDGEEEIEVFDFAPTPFGSGPSNTAEIGPETPEEDEAPMALWAEQADTVPEEAEPPHQPDPMPPMLKVTRIGAASTSQAKVPTPTAPLLPMANAPETTAEESNIAMRLRATRVADLSASDRATLSLIRARARSLKDRLGAPPRLDA